MKIKKEAKERCKNEIKEKFDLALAKGNKVTEKKWKRKIKAEEKIRMYKKIVNCRRSKK